MKKQILTIAAVAALVVSSMSTAIADGSGVLTVTGKIGSGTCTVPAGDLTKTIGFGSLQAKDVSPLARYTFAIDPVQVDLHVTGCDVAYKTAAVKLAYTQDTTSATSGYGMANAEPTEKAEIGLVPNQAYRLHHGNIEIQRNVHSCQTGGWERLLPADSVVISQFVLQRLSRQLYQLQLEGYWHNQPSIKQQMIRQWWSYNQ